MAYVNHQLDDYREFKVFPAKGVHSTKGSFFEDDGETYDYQKGKGLWIDWNLTSENQRIDLHIQARGEYQPAWDEINISLPKGELRSLFINGHPINKISLKSIK